MLWLKTLFRWPGSSLDNIRFPQQPPLPLRWVCRGSGKSAAAVSHPLEAGEVIPNAGWQGRQGERGSVWRRESYCFSHLQEHFTGVLAPRAEERLPQTSSVPQKHLSLQGRHRLQRRLRHSGRQEVLLRSLITPLHLISGISSVEGTGTWHL